jgi:hypothetical protein
MWIDRQQRARGTLHRGCVPVEGENLRGVPRNARRETAVAAPELEDAASGEVGQPPQRGEVRALGIKLCAGVGHALGLYALRVVPRAPNFCALRRVSSNLERA